MSDTTTTPRLGFIKPTPGLDDDAWGGHLNANFDALDALVPRSSVADAAPANATDGDTWFCPFFGRLFVRFSNAWVDGSPLLRTPHTGTLPLAFPASPADGTTVTQGTARWFYAAAQGVWVARDQIIPAPAAGNNGFILTSGGAAGTVSWQNSATLVAAKVSRAGDSMTGFLTLNAAPTAALHAATKGYVDQANSGFAGDIAGDGVVQAIEPGAMQVHPDHAGTCGGVRSVRLVISTCPGCSALLRYRSKRRVRAMVGRRGSGPHPSA